MDGHGSAASEDAWEQDSADDDPDGTAGLAVTRGSRRSPPMRPPQFVAPPVNRRRRSDWPVLLVVLIVVGLVMAGCCIAGFALYSAKGAPFK
jgi:hypothetical protein